MIRKKRFKRQYYILADVSGEDVEEKNKHTQTVQFE